MQNIKKIFFILFLSGIIHVVHAQADKGKQDITVYTFQDNDVLRFNNRTDQFYSFGIIAGFNKAIIAESKVNRLFFAPKLGFMEKRIAGFEMALKGYTPEFERNEKLEEIRPFAGTLTVALNLSEVNKNQLLRYNFLLGVRGPSSGAQWVQDNFHELIGSPIFTGWENQLPDKFVFMGEVLFVQQIPVTPYFQVIPQGSLALGNYRTHAEPSLMFKFGKSLPLNESMLFGMPLSKSRKSTELFFTARFYGRGILSDSTLSDDRDLLNQLTDLSKARLQAGFELRINVRYRNIGLFFARQRHSRDSNFTGAHSFGTFGIIIG